MCSLLKMRIQGKSLCSSIEALFHVNGEDKRSQSLRRCCRSLGLTSALALNLNLNLKNDWEIIFSNKIYFLHLRTHTNVFGRMSQCTLNGWEPLKHYLKTKIIMSARIWTALGTSGSANASANQQPTFYFKKEMTCGRMWVKSLKQWNFL